MRTSCLGVLLLAATALDGQSAVRTVGPFAIESELPALPCISQGRTGTCWSFSTVSFLESEAKRLHNLDIDLSEVWLARHTYPEKLRRYVAAGGKAQFSEGGLSHDVLWVAREHGLVPAASFTGLRQGQQDHDHQELFRILESLAKEATREGAPPVSAVFHRAIQAVLDAYLGVMPTEVSGPTGALSPRAWTDQVLGLPLDAYVEVMSLGAPEVGTKAKLEVPDNWLGDDRYLNVAVEDFMGSLERSLKAGYSVVFDLDVSERGFRAKDGIAVLSDELEKNGAVTQAVRDEGFRNGKTTDDHLMHVIGLARHRDGRRFFVAKDSGGPTRGPFDGKVMISENYVRAKVLAFMVHGAAISQP